MPHNEIQLIALPGSISSIVEESPRYRSPLASAPLQLKELRRLEFELGRSLALEALGQAGWKVDNELNLSPAIGKNDDRLPIWPTGFVGSISHSDHWVWAAVARAEEFASIGVDTEVIVDSNRAVELRDSIGRDMEWECMTRLGVTDAIAFTLLFSAKETLFKLCYPLTRKFWEFLDLEVVEVRSDSLADNQPAGTIFLRCRKQISDAGQPDPQSNFILRSKVDSLNNGYPVNFQIVGNDVFTSAMIRSQ